jgi:hypothetical protein
LSPLKARPEPATATGRIRSRFDEELRRMNTIAGQITPHCLMLFNESFAGTTNSPPRTPSPPATEKISTTGSAAG